jgi:hypothetical protein
VSEGDGGLFVTCGREGRGWCEMRSAGGGDTVRVL